MSTDTNVSTLIINKMTQAQYNALATKDPTQVYVITDAKSPTPSGDNGYGVHGDYGMHYGIIASPYGLITQGAGNQLKIPAGLQLCVPGSDTYITLGTATTYDAGSSESFTLFYARGSNGVGATFIEATEVFWSVEEPENNGQTGFQAWWNPEHGMWQMRSNDTGNVWRDIVGCPLCDCKVTDGNIVRVDFIGYRVLNKQLFQGDTDEPGIEKMYAGTEAPEGYLVEDGSAVSRTTYANLFGKIGTRYGAGDGSTTFNLPNRTGYGLSKGGTLSVDVMGNGYALGMLGANGEVGYMDFLTGSSNNGLWVGKTNLPQAAGSVGDLTSNKFTSHVHPGVVTEPINSGLTGKVSISVQVPQLWIIKY